MLRGALRAPVAAALRMGEAPGRVYPRQVLGFERRVVGTLVTTPDPRRRAEIEAFVDGTLRSMPEHLRAGVAAESLLLGVWDRLRRRDGSDAVDLAALDGSRIDVVRQYVRLLRGLVLFAESELAPAS